MGTTNYLEVAEVLLKDGREKGEIKSTEHAFIPELIGLADDAISAILNDALDYCAGKDPQKALHITNVWAAFAGMGAVYYWDNDWPKLEKQGIYHSLTQERGWGKMDEYVLDTIGIPFESDKGKQLTKYLGYLSWISLHHSFKSATKPGFKEILCSAKAMFAFGMVYEMNRLGLY